MTVLLWLAVMVVGVLAASPVLGSASANQHVQGVESDDGQQVLQKGTDHGIQFIALVDGISSRTPATAGVLGQASADVRHIPGVRQVDAPRFDAAGTSAAITVTLDKASTSAQNTVLHGAENRMSAVTGQLRGSTVQFGGDDLITQQTNATSGSDLSRAEMLSLPTTLILLIFVFGGIAAAGLPVLAALATMTGAFGVLLVFSLFVKYDNTVLSVVTILGLGLSIDYGLLLVARYREELAQGYDRPTAISRTWSTAGRTIMFSALTIVVALIGLLLFHVPRLQAMGAAGISAALIAMISGLTLTSALLGVFGRWIKPSKRAVARYAAAARDNVDADEMARGFFARLAKGTQRRPVAVVIAVGVVLLIAASPLLGLTVKLPQDAGLPRTMPAMRVADELHANFGQIIDPSVQVVARTSPAELDAWAHQWLTDPEVAGVEPAVAAAPNLSVVTFAVHGDPQSQAAMALVSRVRADRPAGGQSWVTGEAAVLSDLDKQVVAGLPLAIVVSLAAMIVLLFLMTGSLVVPLTAIAMNVLSLGATFGVLTLVFGQGWLSGTLGTLTVGGLSPTLIVSLAAFAFGFSMDYEVFLLGRIKEYVDRGEETAAAVRYGLQRSGRVITSAALLMLIVFACFGTAKLGDLQQIGVGLFVAVFIDATIVRCLLVPATMTALGRRNWWAPGPLRWLHDRFGLRETAPVRPPELVGADPNVSAGAR